MVTQRSSTLRGFPICMWRCLLLLVSCLLCPSVGLSEAFWLITPDEAAQTPKRSRQVSPDFLKGLFKELPSIETPGMAPLSIDRQPPNTGPRIEWMMPSTERPSATPTTVEIQFIPQDAPVALDSLTVTLLKFIDLDITDRVRPFATAEGIRIPDCELPSGQHELRITIEDVAGGISHLNITIEIT